VQLGVRASAVPPSSPRHACATITGVQANDLPSIGELAHDLAVVLREIGRLADLRFPALEALPSVQTWRQPPEARRRKPPAERELRALAIEYLIEDVTKRAMEPRGADAVEQLFTFGEPDRALGERREHAAKALGLSSGSSFRNARETALLEELAQAIYKYELWSSAHRFEALTDPRRMGATWSRIVEREIAVTITADRPQEQHWEFRDVLRATVPAGIPIYVIELPWTGTGLHRSETVSVLSGPKPDDPMASAFRHRLLSIRQNSPATADYAMTYVWDLGRPISADDEVELRFSQQLIDRADTFVPIISTRTRVDTIVRLLRFRARVPPEMVDTPRGEMTPITFWPHDTGAPTIAPWIAPEEVVPIEPDEDGYYTYIPRELKPNYHYALHWGQVSRHA
jgi:hypothetical protein